MKIKDLKKSCNMLSNVINGKSNDDEEIENYRYYVALAQEKIPKIY